MIHYTVGNPKDILRSYYADLANAISFTLPRVTSGLFSKGLVSHHEIDDALVMGLSDYRIAMKLLRVIQVQLDYTLNPDQYLIDICHVLIKQQHLMLTDIANNILDQLGECVCVCV